LSDRADGLFSRRVFSAAPPPRACAPGSNRPTPAGARRRVAPYSVGGTGWAGQTVVWPERSFVSRFEEATCPLTCSDGSCDRPPPDKRCHPSLRCSRPNAGFSVGCRLPLSPPSFAGARRIEGRGHTKNKRKRRRREAVAFDVMVSNARPSRRRGLTRLSAPPARDENRATRPGRRSLLSDPICDQRGQVADLTTRAKPQSLFAAAPQAIHPRPRLTPPRGWVPLEKKGRPCAAKSRATRVPPRRRPHSHTLTNGVPLRPLAPACSR